MESYEAIQKAINRETRAHAKRLGLSYSTVIKWQEASTDFTDSGALNPLDRVERIIETALILGEDPENAFAPLHYLDERFGRVCVDAVSAGKAVPDLAWGLQKSITEFGDLMRETAKALRDNSLTKKEKAAVLREGGEALRQLAAFIQAVRKA